jgi:hypothetical protein
MSSWSEMLGALLFNTRMSTQLNDAVKKSKIVTFSCRCVRNERTPCLGRLVEKNNRFQLQQPMTETMELRIPNPVPSQIESILEVS